MKMNEFKNVNITEGGNTKPEFSCLSKAIMNDAVMQGLYRDMTYIHIYTHTHTHVYIYILEKMWVATDLKVVNRSDW